MDSWLPSVIRKGQVVSIKVTCDCGKDYPVRDALAGKQVECPDCGALLTVPAASSSPRPEAAGVARGDPSGNSGPWVILGCLFALVGIVGIWSALGPSSGKPGTEKTAKVVDPAPVPQPIVQPEPVPEPEPPDPEPMPAKRIDPGLGEHIVSFQGQQATIYAVSVTRDGKRLLSAGGGMVRKDGAHVAADDTAIRIWNLDTDKEERVLKKFPNGIGAAAFSADGRHAALGGAGSWVEGNFNSGNDFDIHIWDLEKDREVQTLKGHTSPVFCLAFSPDGSRLVSGSPDKTVRLWDPIAGRLLHTFSGHSHTINSVAVSPNGRFALSGGGDRIIRVWDLEQKTEVRQFTGHQGIVWAVAFSPDGTLAVSGGGNDYDPEKVGFIPGPRDFDVRLWEVATGKERQHYSGHTEAVSAVAFSSDGRRILSGSFDRTLRLWQASTGRELYRYVGSGGVVNAVTFLPDGHHAVSGGEDRTLRTWNLPLDVPDLVKRLSNREMRDDAIRELGRYGVDGRSAVSPLLTLMPEVDRDTRRLILASLVKLGPPPPEDVALLAPLLKPSAPDEARGYALDMLAALGPPAKALLPQLADMILDPSRTLRSKALRVVAGIGPEARPVVYDGLIEGLRDSLRDVSDAAAAALANMGPPTPKMVPELKKLLRERQIPVRRYALDTLAKLGTDASDAAPALIERMKEEPHPSICVVVIKTLLKVQGNRKMAVAALSRALKEGPSEVSVEAIKGLAELGPDDHTFLLILNGLTSDDPAVARTVETVLEGMTLERRHARGLGEMLGRVKESQRARLLDLISRMGPDGAEAVPGIIALLKDMNAETRLQAVRTLGTLGPAAREAASQLTVLLVEGNRRMSMEVALALARIGAEKESPRAIALLVGRLRVDDPQDAAAFRERETASQALLSLGRPAVAGLCAALESDFAGGLPGTRIYVSKVEARLLAIALLDKIGAKVNLPEAELALAQLEGREPIAEVRKAARNVREKLQDRRATKPMLKTQP
jgi:WD40 repeat protein